MKPAVLYARISWRPADEIGPADADSIADQFARCEKLCDAQGWTIIGREEDRLRSGADRTRPGLARAVALATSHGARLVVSDLSRFSRETAHGLELEAAVRQGGAQLVSLAEMIDTANPYGKFMLSILLAAATYRREEGAFRTSQAMKGHQKRGRRMSRADRAPYGTVAVGDRLVPSDYERGMIDLMQSYARFGRTSAEIATMLNDQGYRNRSRRWRTAEVERILEREGATT